MAIESEWTLPVVQRERLDKGPPLGRRVGGWLGFGRCGVKMEHYTPRFSRQLQKLFH